MKFRIKVVKVEGRAFPSIAGLLHLRHAIRVAEMAEGWQDEAAEAAVAGNPRWADYLEKMAARAPELVDEATERARKSGRSLEEVLREGV